LVFSSSAGGIGLSPLKKQFGRSFHSQLEKMDSITYKIVNP
jgi:hypothetical protein